MNTIKSNQRKLYIELDYINHIGTNHIGNNSACTDRFPEAIMVKFTMRDNTDLYTYKKISEACKKYAVSDKVSVHCDEPRLYKNRRSKSGTTDNANSEDMHSMILKRQEIYSSIRNNLDMIEKIRQCGYIIKVTLPENKYKIEELSDINVETVSMCKITVLANIDTDFYEDFYVKGLLERYSPR
jgi:hypothetical protein